MFNNNNQQGGIFGNNMQQQGGNLQQGGGIFGNNAGGGGGGLFNNQNAGGGMIGGNLGQPGIFGQQNQPQGGGLNTTFGPGQQSYYNQMQTINPNSQYSVNMYQNNRHEQDVEMMIKQHVQILLHKKQFTDDLVNIQDFCKKTNDNLSIEAKKLNEGKVAASTKPNPSLQGAVNSVTPNQQQVEKKGINSEKIEQTGQSLAKIREKNELIFAKLFEIHCLIERIASNANTIERDSNAEMRLFRQFNDIDASLNHQNQKVVDLNQKILDSKNQAGGEFNVSSAHNSSAREQGVNRNIINKKQVLIDMLAQMKKGIEIVKEQHQEDQKDFEILIKKLNQTRTHPF